MTMEKLRAEMTAFFQKLYIDQQKVLVFGEGPLHARLMLIGEAPGEQESLQGRPFVGKAGKNLDEFLALSGLNRAELYITNTVKYRPVRQSAAGNTVNRAPTQEEIRLGLPFLKREIALVAPEVIVTLGNVPLRALMGNGVVIGQVHGELAACEAGRVFPLYHPASIVYNPSLREVYERDVMRFGQLARESGWTEE